MSKKIPATADCNVITIADIYIYMWPDLCKIYQSCGDAVQ